MKSIYYKVFKRLLDLLFSMIFILVFWWFFLIVAFCSLIFIGHPVFFKQRRLGLNGNEFVLYKFRTMTDERDALGVFLPDKERISKYGSFLRSTSLDELPQLFNVIKGEMSLIGPRATLLEYREVIEKKYSDRQLVLPGMTSLAAIKGRNSNSFDVKMDLDVLYVNTLGFKLDLAIFVKTIFLVLSRKGID